MIYENGGDIRVFKRAMLFSDSIKDNENLLDI